jgi:hypothetical protein
MSDRPAPNPIKIQTISKNNWAPDMSGELKMADSIIKVVSSKLW